jgi:RimJ/RimL family protein N-acetyltransferase
MPTPPAGSGDRQIRRADDGDAVAIWAVLEPVVRAGETYAVPRDLTEEAALRWWLDPAHEVWVAVDGAGEVVGSYYLQANQRGAGAHVANCGFVTALSQTGRGVATQMCRHSLDRARERGFLAMQYNLVVSSNERAVALWQRLGFAVVGVLPRAFDHPRLGLVDALVMYRWLADEGRARGVADQDQA